MLSPALGGPPAKAQRSEGQGLDSHPSTTGKSSAAAFSAPQVDFSQQQQTPFPAQAAPAAAAAPTSLGVPGAHAPAAAFAAAGGAASAPGQPVSAATSEVPAVTELSQHLHRVVESQGAAPELLAAMMAMLTNFAPPRVPPVGGLSGAAPAVIPPAPRELPPPGFPADLPTVAGPAVPDLVRAGRVDGTPEEVLQSCWEALIQRGVHANDAMTGAIASFWFPDGARVRDAVAVFEWGRQEISPACDAVINNLAEVSNLRDSLHSASHRLMGAVSRAGFLHHVMRRATHTVPQLEARGPVP